MKTKIVEPQNNNHKIHFAPKMKVHFMGIGGSGISAVAALAKKHGFEVTGCDEQNYTPYLEKIKKLGIKTFKGHDESHLDKDYDLLVISPAIVYQNKNNLEYKKGVIDKKVIVWNKFVGDYLLKDKNVIAVSGTHGKGTTTAMISLLFESSGKDPNVIIGATVPQWKSNFREGLSDIFIIEADEFYEKFLDYMPSTIIINNIEMDHPDYFKDEKAIIKSFVKFVKLLQGDKNLIVNLDSPSVVKLLKLLKSVKRIKIYGYSLKPNPDIKSIYKIIANITKKSVSGTEFSVYSNELGIDDIFKLSIPGDYNVSNALGVIITAKLYGIENEKIHSGLLAYQGLGRRFEKIFDKGNIVVYDDYAHHPTAIQKTLGALRQKYPISRIICIDEPHSYSRTKALLNDYKDVFVNADKVVIGPIFKARDTKTFGVTGKNIVKKSEHKDITYIDSKAKIISFAKKEIKPGDVVIVMGAGESYLWSREIVKKLE